VRSVLFKACHVHIAQHLTQSGCLAAAPTAGNKFRDTETKTTALKAVLQDVTNSLPVDQMVRWNSFKPVKRLVILSLPLTAWFLLFRDWGLMRLGAR
jgi:hypothetical protein